MRRWILNIHMYLALICSSYLIIYGISSLDYNHHWTKIGPADGTNATKWEQAITVPPMTVKRAEVPERLRNELGLFGWVVTWKIRTEKRGENSRLIAFDIERPGKSYTFNIPPEQNKVVVTESPKSWLSIIRNLHALRLIPNSQFVSTWVVYTELCNVAVLFAAVSGIYLWMFRKRERKMGLILLGFGLVFSTSLILYIWRVG
jgi:hypothetical protein